MSPGTESNPAGAPAPAGTPAVVYFAKAPRPGQVKTRLCPPLTPAEAARLYAAFLQDLVVPVAGARTLVYGWPADGLSELRPLVPASLELRPQHGDDLFARMAACFEELFTEGHRPVLIRNTDSPDLPVERITTALERSGPGTVVLGPDLGGGYYLIALAEPCPDLFHGVQDGDYGDFKSVRQRAEQLGLEVLELPAERDVDTFEDLLQMWRERMS
ncbi:MAG: TIGR04282 family arsenosugar biosynthesis glycosyltransferase [Planctomycetota bacterium]